jgi:hypothetical protein
MATLVAPLPSALPLFDEVETPTILPALLEFVQAELGKNIPSSLSEDIVSDYAVETISLSIPDFIKSKISEECLEEGFYVFDFGALISQYNKFIRLMPRVEPFYG